jgi:predicted dehydrogenase
MIMHKPSARPFNRRQFISCAGAALVAPLILGGCASQSRHRVSSSDRIRLGFIGMGKQSESLLGACLPRNDIQVLAVCDVDTTRRKHAQSLVESHYASQRTSGLYQGCAAYDDFRDLLARGDIDAVVIATPDHWHALMTIAAAEAGKDIYCEKPVSHTIREGRAMVRSVRKNRRILQVGSMQRSAQEFRIASELVRNGVLGEVTRAEFALGGLDGGGPPMPCNLPGELIEPGLDWNLWLGPAPWREYNSILSPRGVHKHFPAWRNYSEYGGGGICDWGAHHLDIIHWAFGFDASGPVEITPPENSGTKWGACLRYANGLVANHVPVNESEGSGITFYGTRGKLFVGRRVFKLWLNGELKTEDVLECRIIADELLPPNANRLYRSEDHIGNWLDCIRTRQAPICDVETGHRTATVCHLLNLAYQHNQHLQWNPLTEQFAGDTGDERWLSGNHRAPWKIAAAPVRPRLKLSA